jgi:hypothetical protein
LREELDRRRIIDPAYVAQQLTALDIQKVESTQRDATVTAALAKMRGSALVTLTPYVPRERTRR